MEISLLPLTTKISIIVDRALVPERRNKYSCETIFLNTYKYENKPSNRHMSSTLWKSAVVLGVVALLSIAVFAQAQEDAQGDEDANDDVHAAGGDAPAEAAEKPLGYGLGAVTIFPKLVDHKTAAGEKVEALIVINNIAGNPAYTAVFVAAHLSPLNDHSRYYQNFSGNAYKRALVPGEATTIKYSFTPDVNAEPLDYSFVVRVFIQPTADPNATFALSAYNSTLTVTEPLGLDAKTVSTVVLVLALVGAAVYHFVFRRESATAKVSKAERIVNEVEIARGVKVDADFLPADHLRHVQALSNRGRSGTPKK